MGDLTDRMDVNGLDRFLKAQEEDYTVALAEIMRGRKRSHWMWYIFPQIAGLGLSELSRHFAVKDITEAEAYLQHPILGERLIRICGELLKLESNDATAIFGYPDDVKLRSSMTLFAIVSENNSIFDLILLKFFGGKRDIKTIRLVGGL
jgi:uncharacterized protein (DUF1810 family)